MLFAIYHALRNIVFRKKQTLKKIFFVGFSLFILFFCIGFINGTGVQMKESLRYSDGDITISSRYQEKDISDISKVVHTDCEKSAVICDGFTLNALLTSDSGYSSATVNGVENNFFPLFEKSIGWITQPVNQFECGGCIIDIKTASVLKVSAGDYITVRYTADDGFMNTIQLLVKGIYIGNQWLYDNVIFVNSLDIQNLLMEEKINCVKVYFNKAQTDVALHEISNTYNKRFFSDVFVKTRTDLQKSWAYQIFLYYRIFLTVVVTIILILLVMIMVLSVKHIYFMEFRKRRKELSTLLAFGMNNTEILFSVFIEAVIFFAGSLCLSGILYKFIQKILSLIHINSLAGQDFVALLGGNSVVISCPKTSIVLLSTIVLVIVLSSSILGAKNYLFKHIKDIITKE